MNMLRALPEPIPGVQIGDVLISVPAATRGAAGITATVQAVNGRVLWADTVDLDAAGRAAWLMKAAPRTGLGTGELDAALLALTSLVDAGLRGLPDEPDWQAPIPLDTTPTLPGFPVEALPGWLAEYVRAVAGFTQTPVDLAGLLALGMLATCCARRVRLQVRPGWYEVLCLFLVAALRPGSRKSAVFAALFGPVQDYEREQAAAQRAELDQAWARQRVAEKALEHAINRAAKPGAGDDPAELKAEVDRRATVLAGAVVPAALRLVLDDCTPERLARALAEQGGSVAMASAEGGIFGMLAGRYSDLPNLDVFLKGHSGDQIRVDRLGREPDYVPAPALTVALTVQPEVLAGLADKPEFRGRDLLGRFAYCLAPDTLGRREAEPPPVPESVQAEYSRRVRLLLDLASATAEGAYGRHLISMSPGADVARLAFQRELEPRLAEGGDLGHITDWAGKLTGAMCRVAALLHMGDHEPGHGLHLQIDRATVERAIRVAAYLTPHALAAFGTMGADPALADARYLLKHITQRDIETFTQRDAHKWTQGHFNRVEPLRAALALLVAHGYVRELPAPTRGGGLDGKRVAGRPGSPRYVVNPLATESTQSTQSPPNADSVDCVDSVHHDPSV